MVIDDLKDILEMVNGWLRFAETKNGVLLSLSMAAATGGRTIGEGATCTFVPCVRYAFLGLFLVSALICFASFIPKLNSLDLRWKTSKPNDVFNILYFGSIAKMTDSEYQKEVSEILKEDKPLDQVERAYVSQIKANATICMAKFNYFKVAAMFAGLGMVALSVLLISGIK